MTEFEPPSDDKANRFDGASVPRSHTGAVPGAIRRSGASFDDAVRDVSIEAMIHRLDAALAAIQSLESDLPGGPEVASPENPTDANAPDTTPEEDEPPGGDPRGH